MRSNINESLNLLKELEVRLKTQQSDKQSGRRIKTQTNQTAVKNPKPWAQRCINAYQQNQQQLKQQNSQLRRHVNRLIKMNDYLKNQLVKGDYFQKKQQKRSTKEEKDIRKLAVQVQYLKELNRQKELQIQYLKQSQSKKKKKSIFTQQLTQQTCSKNKLQTIRKHKRQISSKATVIDKSDMGSSLLRPSSSKVRSKCRLCYD